MILGELIVSVAMQLGPDAAGLTAPSVIKLLIVMVALIVIGPMLAISIRSIWTSIWSGTEYGFWPGLKKWTGRHSTETEMPHFPKKLADQLAETHGPDFVIAYQPLWDAWMIQADFVPSGTLWYINCDMLVHKEVPDLYQVLMSKPMATELTAKVIYDAIEEVTAGSTWKHPKVRKYPTGAVPRSELQELLGAIFRDTFNPIHMEGGETWLEIIEPETFSYDQFSARILKALGLWDE